jgi:hypothetical protein
MLIQTIRQNHESPSIYREQLDAHGPGFLLFMLNVPNFDKLRPFGAASAFGRMSSANGRFMYVDARATLRCFVELCEMLPETLDLFWANP